MSAKKSTMKQQWEQIAAKVNVLSQRERVILCVTAVAVAFIAVYIPLLSSLSFKKGRLEKDLVTQQSRLASIETQIQALETPGANDPNQARRQRLTTLKQEAATIEQEFQSLQKTLVPPGSMTALLEDLLKRNGNLKLVALNTLPVSPLIKPAEAPKVAAPKSDIPQASTDKNAPATPPSIAAILEPRMQIFKHGVEITVEGSYRDFVRYLADLEKLPWRMYWSEVQLKVEEQPPRTLMTFTVFTLSLEKTWLSL
jgi:MSHA biogenesis protein MshJ